MADIATNDPALWGADFPWPAPDTHKYERGELVLWGGGSMTGAARLAAGGAMRAGAGLVRIVCPQSAALVYALDLPTAIVEPGGADAFADILDARRPRAVALGFGAGRGGDLPGLVEVALATGLPCVLDGDALSEIAAQGARLRSRLHPLCVITPHEGEFRRLFPDLRGSRPDRARTAARDVGAVVALKGDATHVAHPDGRVAVDARSTPFLATAGSGDVLAGLTAGLLAQRMAPFEAACAAVWIHKTAALRFGPGLVASDLPDLVPAVLADLRADRPR